MQRSRRQNPYPLTWEIPAGVAVLILLMLVLGVHAGNGLAHLTAGYGWIWPQQQDLFSSIPAVLTKTDAASVGVGGWILAVELLNIAGLSWAAITTWQRWGSDRLIGMATPEQAEQVLGVRRLRKVAHVVRPDLHPHRPGTIGGLQ